MKNGIPDQYFMFQKITVIKKIIRYKIDRYKISIRLSDTTPRKYIYNKVQRIIEDRTLLWVLKL